MRYLVLGASGMAGHVVVNYLLEQGEEVVGLARRKLDYCNTVVMDITRFDKLEEYITGGDFDYVINCVGILNDEADKRKDYAILINSYLPHHLAYITRDYKTNIIQMSTDCVFSGRRGQYTENDRPDGETYYAKTKALGEIIDQKNLTLRCSIVGPDINSNGIGLFNWFMKQKGEIFGYDKSIWTGVTTVTLAKAIHKASHQRLTGLYHLVNNEFISKYELLMLFQKYLEREVKINRVEGVVHDKSLKSTRSDFDFIVPSYEKQISEMKKWIRTHSQLYKSYNINSA